MATAVLAAVASEAPVYAQGQLPVSVAPSQPRVLAPPKQPISVTAKSALLQKLQSNQVTIHKDDEYNILSSSPASSKLSLNAALQQRQILRRLTSADLASRAKLQLEEVTVDLSPVTKNPQSPVNVAKSLRAMPNLATLKSDNIEVLQLDNGVLVQQYLSYRVKPGACTAPANRSRLSAAGVDCPKRLPLTSRIAELSNRSSPRYVSDASERAKIVATMKRDDARMTADLRQGYQTFLSNLKTPSKRSELERELGKSEVARLATLNEDDYIREIVESAETEIDSRVFIAAKPNTSWSALKKSPQMRAIAGVASLAKPKEIMLQQAPGRPNLGALANQGTATTYEPFHSKTLLGTDTYLTGFTHEYSYYWSKYVSKTVNLCVTGCQKTYAAAARAGFHYAAGLRFPIHVRSDYIYEIGADGKVSSAVELKATPINGARADYVATDLPAGQVYDAKEIVLEAGIGAYAGARLPVIGTNSVSYEKSYDFTKYLPAPFTNGQVTPPAPGRSTDTAPFVVDLDLLGGTANFGIAGATLKPLLGVSLSASELEFAFNDRTKNEQKRLSFGNQPITIPVSHTNSTYRSSFAVGDPSYKVRFEIAPGLRAKLWVDVAVWSADWSWDIYIPELKVTLPPQGVRFGCHAGTTCARAFVTTPPSLPTPVPTRR